MSAPSLSVDRFLQAAASAGERGVARIRFVACVLVLLQMVLVSDLFPRLAVVEPKPTLQALGLVLGMAFSVLSVVLLRRNRAPGWLVAASAGADGLFVAAILGPSVAWPFDGWRGFAGQPDWAWFVVVAVAAGFRLSQRAVLAGAVTTGLGLLGLLAADAVRNARIVATEPSDYVATFILWIAAVLLAFSITRRTRRLVDQGAAAAVKAERARQRLGVYVSQEIADEALAADELRPGGERRPVAVLFSDLRGFTGWGEKVTPERLIDELNAYLEAMVAVIRAEGGVVDKYIGDAIMVVFGIPRTQGDEAARALRCVRRMQEALAAHNGRRAEAGLGPLRHGIGLHFGNVVAGNVGTGERLQYTVVGDVVNTASRLEGATKELGEAVLISQDLVDAIGGDPGELGLRPVGELTVRGRETAVWVHGLVDDPSGWGRGERTRR